MAWCGAVIRLVGSEKIPAVAYYLVCPAFAIG